MHQDESEGIVLLQRLLGWPQKQVNKDAVAYSLRENKNTHILF